MDWQDKKYRKTAVKKCEKRIKEIEKEQTKQTAQAAQISFAANSFNYSDIYKKMIANLNDWA